MITIESAVARVNDVVTLAVSVDETILGVQFNLEYVDAALEYVSHDAPAGALATVNPQPGIVRAAISSASPLPGDVMFFTFRVLGSTVLALRSVIGADVNSQDILIESVDGSVQLETGEGSMQVRVKWTYGDASGIGEFRVYQGVTDSDLSGFTVVSTVSGSALESTPIDVTLDQGTIYFFVTAVDPRGESNPSQVVSFLTDRPVAPQGVTVEIIG